MSTETRRYRRVPTPEQFERQARAVQLRASKLTYPQIAAEMGCSLSYAHDLVTKGMRFYLADRGAEQERTEMLARLDVATTALMPRVADGDDKAIDRLMRLEQRRADLLGLDAPKRLDVSGQVKIVTEDALDAEISRLAAELAATGDASEPDVRAGAFMALEAAGSGEA